MEIELAQRIAVKSAVLSVARGVGKPGEVGVVRNGDVLEYNRAERGMGKVGRVE